MWTLSQLNYKLALEVETTETVCEVWSMKHNFSTTPWVLSRDGTHHRTIYSYKVSKYLLYLFQEISQIQKG